MVTFNTSGTFYNVSGVSGQWKTMPFTFTIPVDMQIKCNISYTNNSNITPSEVTEMQLESGTQATEYSPSNPIELCKIGNYVDKLKRAEGKNLFKNADMENAYITSTGEYQASTSNGLYPYTEVIGGQNVSLSTRVAVRGLSINEYTSDKTFIKRTQVNTGSNNTTLCSVTLDNNTAYIRIAINYNNSTMTQANVDTIYAQLEYGTATSYEPYGTNWYIEKNIGKANLEDYTWNKYSTNITGISRFATTGIPNVKYVSTNTQLGNALSNMYVNHTGRGMSNTSYNFCIDVSMVQATDDSTLTKPRGLLYYALATPTYETITNENLIEQLNNIQDIELIENLCYVDWVGVEKPTMTLKYYQGRTLEEINEEYLKDVNVDFGEKYGPINSIVLSRSGESDNVYIQDEDSIEENGLHELKIIDNQLMNFNDRADYLQGLLDKLDGLEYYINDYVSTGILYLDLGDRYYVHIGDNTYSCVMFNDEVDVTLGLQELIHAEMLKESETDYIKADKTDRRINQTYLIIDKQNQTIQSVVNQIGDRSQKQTTITQDIDGINSEVSNLVDVTIEEQTSDNLIEIEGINNSQPIKLKIRPIGSSISYLYPRSNLYPSGSLYSGMRSVLFKRTYTENEDGEEVTKTENIYYELPVDLLYKDSTHYDEFELDYNEKICKVIKKLEYNSNGELVIKAVAETLYFDYPFIEIKDGDYEISIPGYQYAYINVILMKKNEYTTQFTTEVQVNTLIKQTEDEVMIQVNHKVDEDNFTKAEIIARINEDETSEAVINADAISLEGYTTINGGFSVDEEGNANIANGSVKINEEGIQLANGRSVVGGNGMLTQFQYNASGSVGHMQGANVSNQRIALYVPVYIPQNFVITETKLFIIHTPAKVYEYTAGGYNEYICYSRNVKLYKTTNRGTPQLNGGFIDSIAPAGGELIYDFGSSSGKTFSSSSVENLSVSNLKDNLDSGMQYFYLADYVNNPSDWVTASRMSGMVDMTLYVTGFLQNNIE